MKKIGITGGIGSGKTLVTRIFKTLGVKVYHADLRAKELLDTDPEIRATIADIFGAEVYRAGKADRAALAGKVFGHPEALAQLNSIVHPAVFRDFERWALACRNEIYTVMEAAILFESGADQFTVEVILVYSPPETRLQRVMQRDNLPREAVLARMRNQMSEEEKMKICDYVIYNDEGHSLIRQVLDLHNQFITR
jgi:dephospho-CoA kinase